MTGRRDYRTVVVFADVSGSSRLYKRVGNDEAARRIGAIVDRLIATTEEHGGVVVKTIGDEVMAHFTTPDDAHAAGIAFQRAGEDELPIRVGMAWGSVIEKDGDLFGEAVNDAAAVVEIARSRQILTTDAHRRQLSVEKRESLSRFDEVRLKGERGTTTLYRVEWDQLESGEESKSTLIRPEIDTTRSCLTLRHPLPDGGESCLTLAPDEAPLHIGRDPRTCRILTPSRSASRDHCHLTFHHGNFVLVDHSTNGTYVRSSDGREVYLRRSELPLQGSGEIAFGERLEEAGSVLRFEV